jgi:hypothetical protein
MNAAKCLDAAQGTTDWRAKRVLLDTVPPWLALADQGEKNRQTTPVHETLEPQVGSSRQAPSLILNKTKRNLVRYSQRIMRTIDGMA